MTPKDIRKQIRNVAQEILPELLSQEAIVALEKRLVERVAEQLNRIEQNQKDMQSFVLRSAK